ncbi:MAG TPA: hypothetical protein VHW96_13690 [Solirubrobacteraceae bacterium]|nr:hypothetical protein [Solirubrobacteraceae bacterium]
MTAAALGVLAAGAGPALAKGRAGTASSCQPYSAKPCLFPYPDNRLTRPDHTSATKLRVNLPASAMPVNTKGVRIKTAAWDRNDGFSPGSAIVLHIPGLDNAAALKRTGVVPVTNIAQSLAKRQPIVLIDQATGRRQLIWAELDVLAKSAGATDLVIHPAKLLAEGHTFVVALRNLRTKTGKLIPAPKWFALLRGGGRLPKAERPQTARYAKVFKALKRAGIALNQGLYEAWNFTVDSRRSLTGGMLAIRNNAFAQLGDANLADSVDSGHAPGFTVTETKPLVSSSGAALTQVDGTLQVPCYLIACGPSTQPGFHYGSKKPEATPTQIPGNVATTTFECVVPSTASALTPARISLYGHGLLGSADEVTATPIEALATGHNIVICSTDFWGLANGDTLNDAAALGNLNLFPAVIDRLQQGALNMLYLGRLMLNAGGLASNAAFQQLRRPVIETSNLYYDGNSQGGIEGGMLTALSPDFRHAVLGVTGIDYANVLVQRSTDFAPFGTLLYAAYPDQSLHPLLLDLMQQLWDRGEPDGYAEQMTTHPLPGTPPHQVLMQLAYGDHQVSMYAGAIEARTVGASAYQPALDLSTNRAQDRNLFYGLPTIKGFPFSGSAVEVWDSGPGHTSPPPLTNTPPAETTTGDEQDPHEDPRNTPAAQQQISDFLTPTGAVTDVCGGTPCRSSDYTP